ncbi:MULTISPECIES: VOC family protein [Actinokineospora]|uniref:Glyoxalase n=1 Tax=Actinokineospora fastidiosa TaxID=1816 RepID=A0A918L997_9PSEU|nr:MULTISPECIES: VOC family protein [Actinokineospora]UVS82369.1 putative enzyme related to lactoylglutathione lyase [Actinokineospora sp. UTMC 2448]GGS21714.1 glyoxalase [Actinokineospora fastidiosa]
MADSRPTRLTVVLDCPDPAALADFYRRVLEWPDEPEVDDDGGWVNLDGPLGRIAFQRIPDYVAPTWPGGEHPQMLHLDLRVDDLDAGHERVTALGAKLLDETYAKSFRVYADPAGHPFCLTV